MTEREKLVESIKNSLHRHIGKSCLLAENIADYIIADGWIRPPCQEKDEFFILEKTQDGTRVTKLIVRFVSIYKNRFEIYCDTEARDGGYHFEPCRIGEDIYYTKEEAGKALKGGEQK